MGEPINPEAWMWYYRTVGDSRCPIVDTWWQTETGGILIAPQPGAIDLKPGSATKPFYGIKPVLVDKDGKIVTNFHVIKEAFKNQQRLIIELNNGEISEAIILGFSEDADIAVIQTINNPNLKPIKIKKNIDELRVGEQVIAIGNPQGLGKSFSMGIVSAINRQFKNVNGSFIQTDASINPGNSGGALIDRNGYLIGITNLIETTSGGSQGLNFAIPVDEVLKIYDEIIN